MFGHPKKHLAPPFPLHRLARLVLEETYDNSGHFDLTFLMFVWMAFLPTVINPWIYATWVLSRWEHCPDCLITNETFNPSLP